MERRLARRQIAVTALGALCVIGAIVTGNMAQQARDTRTAAVQDTILATARLSKRILEAESTNVATILDTINVRSVATLGSIRQVERSMRRDVRAVHAVADSTLHSLPPKKKGR